MKADDDKGPKPADATGCLLLGGSMLVCAGFGLMTLGSYFTDLARIGFAVSLIALVASAVLSAGLVGFADYRIRQETQGWRIRGENLDRLGTSLGVERQLFETDERYRKRIGSVLRAHGKP